MADEISVMVCLKYSDDEGDEITLAVPDYIGDITTKKYQLCKHNVGLTEEAMKLGELTALGWCLFANRDETNFVEIRTATSGTKMVKVPPLASVCFYFGSGVTAPFVIADTAPCQCAYLILST